MRERFGAADQYGLVLALILVSLILVAVIGNSVAGKIVADVLLAGVALFAIRTSGARPRVVYLASLAFAIALIISTISAVSTAASAGGIDEAVTASLVIATPLVIGRRLAAAPEVTLQKVLGALCIYLLLGMFFGYVFQLTAWFGRAPFFEQQSRPQIIDYLYFSYTSLTTVGYGDLTARSELGRMLAISEALFGQLYLVTVVAVLVGQMRARHEANG